MSECHLNGWCRKRIVIWGGLIIIVVLLLLGVVIQSHIQRYIVLNSEAASDELVKSLILKEVSPGQFVEQLWQTRKIPQRQIVLDFLKIAPSEEVQTSQMTALIESAALDADENARERALALLDTLEDPHFLDYVRAQLRDADPQIRLLGLQDLRTMNDKRTTPILIDALNDPDPVVAASADSILRLWTGNDFRMRDTLNDAAQMAPVKLASFHATTDKWNSWWQTNRSNYPAVPSISIALPPLADEPLAGDFALKDLEGKTVHLHDFKGKVVLLDFWTTWCTACLEEVPRLVALQKNHPDELIILSVSLDGAAVEDADEIEGKAGTKDDPLAATPTQIHEKIERLVKSRGINYPILLDPHGNIGARFNGHELPTNVFIDVNGVVRRRFIGSRSLATLEAMLRDASASQRAAR